MQRHFNDYWTISFYNKRKYFICSKWSKTKKYLRTEFKTNCLGLCWVWWRGTATQKFPLLPSPSTRSPFPSVGQRLTSFSSLFLLNFFSIFSLFLLYFFSISSLFLLIFISHSRLAPTTYLTNMFSDCEYCLCGGVKSCHSVAFLQYSLSFSPSYLEEKKHSQFRIT